MTLLDEVPVIKPLVSGLELFSLYSQIRASAKTLTFKLQLLSAPILPYECVATSAELFYSVYTSLSHTSHS